MKKSFLKISSALMIGALVLVSCNKTVTSRKLDGEWTVTAGSGTTTSNYSSSNTISVSTFTYDGKNVTQNSGALVTISPLTISYTFDKENGTYKKVETYTSTESDQMSYYTKNSSGTYSYGGSLDRKDVEVSTVTEEGTFTITGGTGEIEKNTQIVFLPTSTLSNSTHTYSYYTGTVAVTDLSGKYVSDYSSGSNSYSLIPSTKVSSTTNTGVTTVGEILTVTSLKGGVMEVVSKNTSNETSGASSSSYSSEMKWTLTAK